MREPITPSPRRFGRDSPNLHDPNSLFVDRISISHSETPRLAGSQLCPWETSQEGLFSLEGSSAWHLGLGQWALGTRWGATSDEPPKKPKAVPSHLPTPQSQQAAAALPAGQHRGAAPSCHQPTSAVALQAPMRGALPNASPVWWHLVGPPQARVPWGVAAGD